MSYLYYVINLFMPYICLLNLFMTYFLRIMLPYLLFFKLAFHFFLLNDCSHRDLYDRNIKHIILFVISIKSWVPSCYPTSIKYTLVILPFLSSLRSNLSSPSSPFFPHSITGHRYPISDIQQDLVFS